MCQACGYRVHLLRRVRIMNIQLGGLKTGEYRKITGEEYKRLIKLLEVPQVCLSQTEEENDMWLSTLRMKIR